MLVVAALAVAASAVGQAAGQQGSATTSPVFDAVSVRVNNSGGKGVDIGGRDDVFLAKNITVRQLLANAYDIREDLILGVIGPMESARFDIQAKIDADTVAVLAKLPPEERTAVRRKMMQQMLTERFKLKAHTEFKELPVYELRVQPGGPKFKQIADANQQNSHMSVHGGKNKSELSAENIPMRSLAEMLADQVHRTVIDKTGLAGTYELTLTWSNSDNFEESQEAPTIFTAVQEQLGLKLQPAKGPVETLVVDHVEMPSEN